jgi:hypothetical protein
MMRGGESFEASSFFLTTHRDMTSINFIFQPPYALMVGAEVFQSNEDKIDGFAIHLLLFSVEVYW